MSTPSDPKMRRPSTTAAATSAGERRKARLAVQLRANLNKRKALARTRDGDSTEGPGGDGSSRTES